MANSATEEAFLQNWALPLAQVYRRALGAKTPLERYTAASQLWESALKLLGSVAVIEYAAGEHHDPAIDQQLQTLARPSLGHWCGYVRALVPYLAQTGDAAFTRMNAMLFVGARDEFPRAAGLQAKIEALVERRAERSRSTVELGRLLDHVVTLRNRDSHGALGAREAETYDDLAEVLLAAARETFGKIDLTAGRRLIYVSNVYRLQTGDWRVDRCELRSPRAQMLPPLDLPEQAAHSLPLTQRVFVLSPGMPIDDTSVLRPSHSLYPLAVYDAEQDDLMIINGCAGKRDVEYLSYLRGVSERAVVLADHRELMSRILRAPVKETEIERWAGQSLEVEPKEELTGFEPGKEPQRIGEYELLTRIGRGGMGTVYRAWQPSLRREVALKRLNQSEDDVSQERFQREIRALGRVDHPNLVKVHTCGTDKDRPFYVMELIEGADLGQICLQMRDSKASDVGDAEWERAVSTACEHARTNEKHIGDSSAHRAATPRSGSRHSAVRPQWLVDASASGARGSSHVRHAVELARQTAEALDALHNAGIIHRDIKPENILVTPDGKQAVLADLGLAQLADEVSQNITRTREWVGTLRYASPEQILAAKRVDQRTDVYSLGVTMWELLTLRPIFGVNAKTPPGEIMERTQYEEAESVRKYNPHVSRDLDRVVRKCLEKDPTRRYATARELADDLGKILAGERPSVRPRSIADTLRTRINRVKRRPGRYLTAALVMLAMGFVVYRGWWYLAYERPYVEHFSHYLEQRWEFVGLGNISEAETHGREHSYRVTRQGYRGPILRAEIINGVGRLHPWRQFSAEIESKAEIEGSMQEDERTGTLEYVRDPAGVLKEIRAQNRARQLVWIFHFLSWPQAGYFQHIERDPSTDSFQPSFLPEARAGTPASHLTAKFDDNGWPKEIRLFEATGAPASTPSFGFGQQYQRNERGQTTRWTYLGRDGKPAPLGSGVAYTDAKYDERGNRVESLNYDAQGKLIANRDRIAIYKEQYDKLDRRTVYRYYGVEPDKLVLNRTNIAGEDDEYDDDGNQTVRRYVGLDGKPTMRSDGYAIMRASFDKLGNEVRREYLNVDGKTLVELDGGVAGSTSTYDDDGHEIRHEFFGLDGKSKRHNDGNLGWKAVFKAGRRAEIIYFGYDGKLGYTQKRTVYDDRGRDIEHNYWNDKEEPVLSNKDNIATWKKEYDNFGNETKREYFGVDGKPTQHKAGYAGTIAEFKDNKMVTQVAYGYGNDRKYTKQKLYFDNNGRALKSIYLNDQDQPVLDDRSGVTGWVMEHDAEGHETKRTYFGVNNQPIRHSDGSVGAQSIYEGGKLRARVFFGYDGKRGFTKQRVTYDDKGRSIKSIYLNEQDQPVLDTRDLVAGWLLTNNDDGLEIDRAYIGVDEQPVRDRDGELGYRQRYGTDGKRTERTYYGFENKPYAVQRSEYDANERETSFAYLDADNKLVLDTASQIAGWWRHYDDKGNESKREFFDSEKHPKRHADGNLGWTATYDGGRVIAKVFYGYLDRFFTKQKVEYDKQGRSVRSLTLNDNEELVTNPVTGIAGYTRAYDDNGNEILREFLGADGKPHRTKDGNLGETARYENGKIVESIKFGYDGKSGFTKRRVLYDKTGREYRTEYLNDQDKLVLNTVEGNAGWQKTFDAAGNETSRDFLDVTGQPATKLDGDGWTAEYDNGKLRKKTWIGYSGLRGYTKIVQEFDAKGRIISQTNLNDKNERVLDRTDRVAGWISEFDDADNETRRHYLGVDGKPTRHAGGNLGWTASYKNGQVVERIYFGYDKKYTSKRVLYDDKRRDYKYEYLDANNNPTYDDVGSAGFTSHYDADGQEIKRENVDTEGKPVRTTLGYVGWMSRWENGKNVEDIYYGYDGKRGYTRMSLRYNAQGKVAQRRYLNEENQGVLDTQDGVGGYTMQYDSAGRESLRRYLDKDGNPGRHQGGYEAYESKYDSQGNLTELLVFGYDGNAGYTKRRLLFDKAGNNNKIEYLDDELRSVSDNVDGIAGYTREFNNEGLETKRTFIGVDQKPTRSKQGYMGTLAEYENGKLRVRTEYGYDGSEGFQKSQGFYNPAGLMTKLVFLNDKDKPTIREDKVSSVTYTYAPDGTLETEAFLGIDGKPVKSKEGFASWKNTRDANGLLIGREHFDENGAPVAVQALIKELVPGSQAELAGLKPGDILLEYNGVRGSMMNIINAIQQFAAQNARAQDKNATASVLRDGKSLSFTFKPDRLGAVLVDIAAPAQAADKPAGQ